MADQLIIRINAQAKGFFDRLDEMKAKTEDLDRALQATAKASALLFAGLTAEIALATHAYAESEANARALNLTLQNQGIYTASLENKYKLLASAIQEKTGIDDDEITKVEDTIQAYLGQTEASEGLLTAIADLSEAKVGDLQATADLIGKGIQGQTMALKKLGIEVEDHITKEERTAQIIEQVTQKFGGQAAAANQGLGSIRGLTSAFGNLQEALGEKFAPVVTAAIQSTTHLLQAAAENRALISLAAAVVAGGAALAGLVAAVSSAGIALTAMGGVAAAVGISLGATVALIGGAALAVAGLAAAVGLYLTRSREALDLKGKSAKDLADQLDELRKKEAALSNQKPGPFYDGLKEAQKTEALRKVRDEIGQVEAAQRDLDKLAEKKGSADKAAQELAAAEARKQAVLKASNEAILLEAEGASQKQIELARQEVEIRKQIEDEKNAAIRGALEERLQENFQLQNGAFQTEIQQQQDFNDQFLAQSDEYNALTSEQKAVFLLQEQQQLQDQLLTVDQIQAQAAATRLAKQIQEHNTYLENTRKFGQAYAGLYKLMHSEVIQGTGQAFGELAQLQSSSSRELKEIGKVAATGQIVIKTAEAAMNIYAGFSTIPIVGQILGIAGAAAAVAFGAEQIDAVGRAADGALVQGGIPGVDSVPYLLQAGELVAPTSNFEEVIGSVRAGREAAKITGRAADQAADNGAAGNAGGAGGGAFEFIFTLKDGLMDFIEGELVNRQAAGIGRVRFQGA